MQMLLRAAGFSRIGVFGPDIYVTRNPVANVAGRTAFRGLTAIFTLLYRLYGVSTREIMTKHMVAVARASDGEEGAPGGAR